MPENQDPNNEAKLEAEVDKMMDPHTPDNAETAPELSGEDAVSTQLVDEQPVDQDQSAEKENEAATSTLDSDQTSKAIDDISRSDSDTVLAAEDDNLVPKVSVGGEKSNIFKRWWRSRPWRYATILIILALIAAAYLVPVSRYWVFNQVGIRGQVAITVLDSTTKLPLSGASVALDGQQKTSGENGEVSFSEVHLGPQDVTVKKLAFADKNEQINVNPGFNELGKLALKAVGVQYKFALTDYLSGQPIIGATVTMGQASAPSDTKGLAVLTLVGEQKSKLNIKLSADGYHDKTVTIASDDSASTTAVSLVPNGKDYFISRSSGDYDVYSADLDGGGRKLVLAGTGNENSDLALLTNTDSSLLALISIRDKHRDASGDPQQALTIINTKTNEPLTIDHATNIRLIGWLDGNTITYLTIHDCSGSNDCYQLKSYNFDNGARKELAQGPSFSSALAINNSIYYTINDFNDGKKSVFASVNSDGTNNRVILKQDVFGVYRSSYNQLDLAATGQWYSYQIGDKTAQKIKAPSNPTSDLYVDSPDGQKSAWLDRRDGQDVLLVYDKATGSSKIVTSLDGLNLPIHWIDNDTLILRSSTPDQTADYAFSLSGGKAKKIVNVTNAAGVDGF